MYASDAILYSHAVISLTFLQLYGHWSFLLNVSIRHRIYFNTDDRKGIITQRSQPVPKLTNLESGGGKDQALAICIPFRSTLVTDVYYELWNYSRVSYETDESHEHHHFSGFLRRSSTNE